MIGGVTFSERPTLDCTVQALEVVVRFHGRDIEDILFDEWDLVYARPGINHHRPRVSPGRRINLAKKFAEFGACIEYRQVCDAVEALEAILGLLDKDRPTPVWTDTYHLPYYSRNNRRHASHAVVAVGYELRDKTVQIVDPSPWQRYRGSLSFSQFTSCLGGCGEIPKGLARGWAELHLPPRCQPPTAASIAAAIERNIWNMTHETRPGSELKGEGAVWGVDGLRQLAQDVLQWSELGEAHLRAMMAGFRVQTQAVSHRRHGHAWYLVSAGRRLHDAGLEHCAVAVAGLAEAWRLPGNMLLKGSRSDEPRDMLRRVSVRLQDLAGLEEATLLRLA